jgi:3-methyladenine DNA glycosylase AlkD
MTRDEAIAALAARAVPGKAEDMAAYHKAPRRYLGTANPEINALTTDWRHSLSLAERIVLAEALWQSDIHEARIAAAKILTQARIKDDGAVWDLIASWVPAFDAWAIADHVCDAGARRLVAEPARLDQVELWLDHPILWTRRAALVMTLPWTKQNHPTPEDLAIRDRVLDWCVRLSPDRDWFIQKAVAWWLRDLSKHDPDRARAWLSSHGEGLKPFARMEAARHLAET